eukprot:Nk52_evm21s310 gene=Nk52_evmTU21s310
MDIMEKGKSDDEPDMSNKGIHLEETKSKDDPGTVNGIQQEQEKEKVRDGEERDKEDGGKGKVFVNEGKKVEIVVEQYDKGGIASVGEMDAYDISVGNPVFLKHIKQKEGVVSDLRDDLQHLYTCVSEAVECLSRDTLSSLALSEAFGQFVSKKGEKMGDSVFDSIFNSTCELLEKKSMYDQMLKEHTSMLAENIMRLKENLDRFDAEKKDFEQSVIEAEEAMRKSLECRVNTPVKERMKYLSVAFESRKVLQRFSVEHDEDMSISMTKAKIELSQTLLEHHLALFSYFHHTERMLHDLQPLVTEWFDALPVKRSELETDVLKYQVEREKVYQFAEFVYERDANETRSWNTVRRHTKSRSFFRRKDKNKLEVGDSDSISPERSGNENAPSAEYMDTPDVISRMKMTEGARGSPGGDDGTVVSFECRDYGSENESSIDISRRMEDFKFYSPNVSAAGSEKKTPGESPGGASISGAIAEESELLAPAKECKKGPLYLLDKKEKWTKGFFVIESGKFLRLNDDFELVELESLAICKVKTLPNAIFNRFNCFEVVSPRSRWVFQSPSTGDMNEWICFLERACEEMIHCGQLNAAELSYRGESSDGETEFDISGVVYDTLRLLDGNNECCDCGSVDPEWGSINLGILICIECSGIHRKLGVHISKVRSLKLDRWKTENFEVMKCIGNAKFNAEWEWDLGDSIKPGPNADLDARNKYIHLKYVERKFKREEPVHESISLN